MNAVLLLLVLWVCLSVLVGCLVGFVLSDRQADESPNAVVYPLAWRRRDVNVIDPPFDYDAQEPA